MGGGVERKGFNGSFRVEFKRCFSLTRKEKSDCEQELIYEISGSHGSTSFFYGMSRCVDWQEANQCFVQICSLKLLDTSANVSTLNAGKKSKPQFPLLACV